MRKDRSERRQRMKPTAVCRATYSDTTQQKCAFDVILTGQTSVKFMARR
jgi:hypothetical protein